MYYDPSTGRFLSEDPIRNGLNFYTYCKNNPSKFLDPWGLAEVQARAYAESYGATVTWTGNTTTNGVTIANANVSFNGKTLPISGLLKNGSLTLDDTILNNYFSWGSANPQYSTAVYALQSDGVIKKDSSGNYQYNQISCSIPVNRFIYQTCVMLQPNNFEKMRSAFTQGENTQNAFIIYYGYDSICFTGDTTITTQNGLKEIKEINIGDQVLSENIETCEKDYKKVVNKFVHKTNVLLSLTLDNTVIQTTISHPFWVSGKGWVAAGDLQDGDKLLSSSGTLSAIKGIAFVKLDHDICVYNFEVEDWHTYFVSNDKILVHNTCYMYNWHPDSPHGTPVHYDIIGNIANSMVASGKYSSVFINTKLSTVGLNGTKQPDIIGIGTDGNPNMLVEVQSPSQTSKSAEQALIDKLEAMGMANPGAVYEYYDVDGNKIIGE